MPVPRPTSRRERPGEQGGRRRRHPPDRNHDVRRFRRCGFRGRPVELARGRRRPRSASTRVDRLGDRAGLGGQPRVVDLRAGRALDRLLVGVRGDLLDAVHPSQPRRARCRVSRSRIRVPPHRAPRPGPRPGGDHVRAGVGAHPVLPGHGRRRDRRRARTGRQRDGRHVDQLAQSALARDRGALRGDRRLPRVRVPGQRRPACRRTRSRAVLLHPRARRRGRDRGARSCRPRLPAPRRPLHLRRPHRRRAAARDPLGASAGSRCWCCSIAVHAAGPARSRSAPSPQ